MPTLGYWKIRGVSSQNDEFFLYIFRTTQLKLAAYLMTMCYIETIQTTVLDLDLEHPRCSTSST